MVVFRRNIPSGIFKSSTVCQSCMRNWKLKRKSAFNTQPFSTEQNTPRMNYANIQMLSKSIYKQLFKNTEFAKFDETKQEKIKEHLEKHDLWGKESTVLQDVDFVLPAVKGDNLEEHYQSIALKQSKFYMNAADHIANAYNDIPDRPKRWEFLPGWTKYDNQGAFSSVSFPDDNVLIFDVEVCMAAGNIPVLATAASKNAWYCWVSEILIDDGYDKAPSTITPELMIPVENNEDQLIIGHHVCFDRSFVKEQYTMFGSKTRFLDTLSLHVCVSGVTNEQRNYLRSNADGKTHYDWMDFGSMNSLAKVYEFYCGKELDKSTRDYFVSGTLKDIRENFQECAQYCSSDVLSTQAVFATIWPMFQKHAPHPVTFAGMLEMGMAYLPIDQTWLKYIEDSEHMYTKISAEMRQSLMKVADSALELMIDDRYKEDPWLWNLDWSIHKCCVLDQEIESNEKHDFVTYNETKVEHLSEKRRKQLHLPGYPKWYRNLCLRPQHENYKPGPYLISSQTRVTPSLLRMTWDGYPLHHEIKYGWGYLLPNSRHQDLRSVKRDVSKVEFPIENYMKVVSQRKNEEPNHHDNKPGIDIGLDGVLFYRLPHKNGEKYNVGNPLAKDFLGKIEDGTLATTGAFSAKDPVEMNIALSFWRNGRKRICSQRTVWLDERRERGVILPQVVTAGTVTRRAVEPTWLTASNPLSNRIGSELKSMVRAPPGYCFVGADVDSQELWIASILGDALFSHMHGSTALSWMTLQGKKSLRTDLHSKTADTIGMDREQAKIFNYGRIYGAGERFAVRLLMQFNQHLTVEEAEEKAAKLYAATKGVKKFQLTKEGERLGREFKLDIDTDGMISYEMLKRLLNLSKVSWEDRECVATKAWQDGSESSMFNKLESIAVADEPRTPVLGCMITNALLPKHVHNHYMTSRVNWVVQSSAVDYLHLLLCTMRWLLCEYSIRARFSISIHDEVRYIVDERDKYRAALALQVSNLLTRAMFAYKLRLNDLPQSVAFFSSVDIDKVLRKEVDMECITPSNPLGLSKGHGIPKGESLDILELLEKTNNGVLHAKT